METSFDEALKLAKEKYPYPINHYEEYRDYFVFEYNDGRPHDGGPTSPIVIRKSDMAALNYNPAVFLGLFGEAGDIGDVLAEGEIN